MTTDDELRKLIALGEKATARPWGRGNFFDLAIMQTDKDSDGYGVAFCYPWGEPTDKLPANAIQKWERDCAYITAAANLAPAIARELIAARELPAKITEISELASEMWYRLVIIANDVNNWEVYLEFVDPSDEGIEGESISVYADTMIAAIDKAIRRLKCGDL